VTITFAPATTRHIRVTQTGAAAKWWSIAEVSVLGQAPPPPAPTVVPREGWSAKASPTSTGVGAAIDGSPATRWTTGAPQAKGQHFQVDFGAARTVSQLTLDSAPSPGDFARGYQVLVSKDGKAWSPPIATGYGVSKRTTVTFPPQRTRFIRVALTEAASNWWSIHELNAWR
jgi:hypothetical protein